MQDLAPGAIGGGDGVSGQGQRVEAVGRGMVGYVLLRDSRRARCVKERAAVELCCRVKRVYGRLDWEHTGEMSQLECATDWRSGEERK